MIGARKRDNMADFKAIGRRIRMQRNLKSLTQEQLAEMTNISTSFVGHLERGEKMPSVETIMKISESLDMDLNYLLNGRLKCDRQNCPLYEAIINIIEK